MDEARRPRSRLDDLLTDVNLADLLCGFEIEPPAAGLDAPLPADLAGLRSTGSAAAPRCRS